MTSRPPFVRRSTTSSQDANFRQCHVRLKAVYLIRGELHETSCLFRCAFLLRHVA